MTDVRRLRSLLIRLEGLRLKPYRCSEGRLTIGIGRNLDDVGISQLEALQLFANDLDRVASEAQALGFFRSLDPIRQDVVLCMLFQLGMSSFLGFRKFIGAVEDRQYDLAADEMLSSKWHGQTPERVEELADMMRSGRYQDEARS